MRNYWSNSKLADFVRGTVQPKSVTGKEWREWTKLAKEKHPIRFWVTDVLFDKVQDTVMYPIDKLYAVKYWLVNYFTTKTHTLTSNLKRGVWHEMSDRIINCLFDELVNFVEIESAWNYIIWDKEARKKYDPPFTATGWFRLRTWRSPEAGIASLKWQTELVKDENYGLDKNDPKYGTPTHQAIAAEKILELYNWWKSIRPNRPDPYEASGWTTICDRRRERNDGELWWSEDESDEEREESGKSLDMIQKLEEEYEAEDTAMLIELIKIRGSLWT